MFGEAVATLRLPEGICQRRFPGSCGDKRAHPIDAMKDEGGAALIVDIPQPPLE